MRNFRCKVEKQGEMDLANKYHFCTIIKLVSSFNYQSNKTSFLLTERQTFMSFKKDLMFQK